MLPLCFSVLFQKIISKRIIKHNFFNSVLWLSTDNWEVHSIKLPTENLEWLKTRSGPAKL